MSTANTKIRLRPYLTPDQIAYILDMIEPDNSGIKKSVEKALKRTLLSYNAGLSSPAYQIKRMSVEESLGVSPDDLLSDNLTPEEEAELTRKLMAE